MILKTPKEDFSMSNRNYDVTALGELLIDFTENGTSAQGNPIMERTRAELHVMFWLCLSAWQKTLYRKSWKGYVRKPAEGCCGRSWN